MRSVVVVLPASMCAMMPMFRVFSSGKLRAMVPKFSSRDKPQKKAPGGPAKRPAKKQRKLPERRAMIAAGRRRISALPERLHRRSRQLDRIGNRGLERAYPAARVAQRQGELAGRRAWGWLWPRLRPLLGLFFRAVAGLERWVRRLGALLVRVATAASALITPARAAALVLIAAGACLVASQFIDYRAVEIGQPGYAGLSDVSTAAAVPTLAVILLVDLPHGLDEGAQTSRFAGASAVLQDGFFAELAAAGGMVLAGLLYYARPCRIRINLSGRAASARRRRPRRRASSRARVARSASRPRRSAASAPASPR